MKTAKEDFVLAALPQAKARERKAKAGPAVCASWRRAGNMACVVR